MEGIKDIINKILVQLFNDILHLEEKSLDNTEFDNLTLTEIHTIEAIGYEGGRMMGEVAHDLRITDGTLSIAVTKLIKKGYVIRERSEVDRRKVYIFLTDSGKKVLDIHNEFHRAMIEEMLDGFTVEEEVLLSRALLKLTDFFERKYED